MYRIGQSVGTAAAVAAFIFCFTPGDASAASCDSRIPGSCPNAPIEVKETVSEPSEPLKITRTGKSRTAKRGSANSRKARVSERRKVAQARKRAPKAEASEEATSLPIPVARPARLVKSEIGADAAPPAGAPEETARLPDTMSQGRVVTGAVAAGAKLDMGWSGAPLPSSGFVAPPRPAVTTSPGKVLGETTGRALREEPDQSASPDVQAPPPLQLAALATPAKISMGPAQEPTETPWLRLAFIGAAGLLAFGSAIRLFV